MIFSTLLLTASLLTADDEILMVDADALSGWWVPADRHQPKYPRSAAINGIEGCARIGFIIEPDGTTSTHDVLQSNPLDTFEAEAIEALARWHFEPSPDNPDRQPVYATQILSFELANNARSGDPRGCIPDADSEPSS